MRVHHKHSYCMSCRTPVQRQPHTLNDGRVRLWFPTRCQGCEPLPRVSILKDGSRGYLWALYPRSEASGGDGKSWFERGWDGERARDILIHGWSPTEEQALVDAVAKAGGPVAADTCSAAAAVAEEYRIERKTERLQRAAGRNRGARGSHAVEYLYEVSAGHDDDTGQWCERIIKHQITKRTSKRVYFRTRPADFDTGFYVYVADEVTFVEIAALEAARDRGQVPYAWCRKMHKRLYTETHAQEELARLRREEQEWLNSRRRRRSGQVEPGTAGEFDLKECRRQMQRHHPDKGGDPELFRLWRARFDAVKVKAKAA